MVSRRAVRVLLVVGVILITVGLGAIVYGSAPAGVTETDPLPPGWPNYDEFQWGVVAGGTVQGNWTSLNGTPVQVFVYNDAEYTSYANGANLTGLYNVTAVSGTISLSVPGFDTYHVVIQHGAGYENTTQNVFVNLTTTGADPTFTIGGILAVAIGGLLIAYAVRRSRRAEAPSGTLPSRATIQAPPTPPSTGPDTSTSGTGMIRVPPPLPGEPGNPPSYPGTNTPPTVSYPGGVDSTVGAAPAGADKTATGTVLVTVANRAAADVTLQLLVNGVAVTSMTVRGGQSQEISVSARLASPFGSTVTVEAVTADGKRYHDSVFVGGRGTAPLTLRIG